MPGVDWVTFQKNLNDVEMDSVWSSPRFRNTDKNLYSFRANLDLLPGRRTLIGDKNCPNVLITSLRWNSLKLRVAYLIIHTTNTRKEIWDKADRNDFRLLCVVFCAWGAYWLVRIDRGVPWMSYLYGTELWETLKQRDSSAYTANVGDVMKNLSLLVQNM